MVDERLTLHQELEVQFPDLTLYFNPPSKVQLIYPCIIYTHDNYENNMANNSNYKTTTIYQITIMSRIPGIDVKPIFNIGGVVNHVNSFTNEDIIHEVFTARVKI
jgi:hypothetical protein